MLHMFGMTLTVRAAVVAGLLLVPAHFAAAKAAKTSAKVASCCATKTRCCDKVKFCCDQPEKAECCQKGIACCDKTPCCGPAVKKATKKALKASTAPSCCSKPSKA